ncbi:hypothetical protein AU184_26685 [Mycolicibacterium novocastrense]|nr:hypothetical protein AU183_04475 [Mycolicibacterium novocastrense]KUH68683.1 hypothetical protein AU184_26685 [Mycolicibacterium novocastrense]KUH74376.1 hypothetical protein AU072_17280 [Mycolicibacterium novocastrense]
MLRGEKTAEDIALRDLSYYSNKGIDLILGDCGVNLDVGAQQLTLSSGRVLSFDKLLLAPGSHPSKLPVPGGQLDGVHYFRTIDDAHRLKKWMEDSRPAQHQRRGGAANEVVIVGGGFVGCEIASALAGSGRRIHLVEADSGLMVRALGHQVGQLMAERHREAGVNLHLGVQVTQVCGDDRAHSVVLSNGAELNCDTVVVGIGAVPTVGWLESSGLTLSDGITVDEYARTSNANVYAAGDAARFWSPSLSRRIRVEHEANALSQAVVAARNMLGSNVIHDPLPYVWSEQFDLDIWCLGELHGHDDIELIIDRDRWAILAVYYKEGRPTSALGVNVPNALAPARTLFQTRKHFTVGDIAAATT